MKFSRFLVNVVKHPTVSKNKMYSEYYVQFQTFADATNNFIYLFDSIKAQILTRWQGVGCKINQTLDKITDLPTYNLSQNVYIFKKCYFF